MRCSSVSLRGSFTAGNLKGMEVVLTPHPASAGPVWRAGWWGLMRRIVVMALLSRGVHGVATTATFRLASTIPCDTRVVCWLENARRLDDAPAGVLGMLSTRRKTSKQVRLEAIMICREKEGSG
jgi:hypothetical protein